MQLTQHVSLEDLPCYQNASASEIARVTPTLEYVIEPIWMVWGPVQITSWKWWHDQGCAPRSGPHSGGGTLDFVPVHASLQDVFDWGKTYLLPLGFIGRWIIGPPDSNHIHVSPLADMYMVDGLTDISAWVENPVDHFTPVPGWEGSTGAVTQSQIEGLVAPGAGGVPTWTKVFTLGAFAGVVILVLKKPPKIPNHNGP